MIHNGGERLWAGRGPLADLFITRGDVSFHGRSRPQRTVGSEKRLAKISRGRGRF